MALQQVQVTRIFKHNGKQLSDPDPSMSAEQVMDFYALSTPEIASAKLVGPEMNHETGEYVYEFKTSIASKG